jgi:hypothetical protein
MFLGSVTRHFVFQLWTGYVAVIARAGNLGFWIGTQMTLNRDCSLLQLQCQPATKQMLRVIVQMGIAEFYATHHNKMHWTVYIE